LQAEALAADLADGPNGPGAIVTSPLRRAQETAAPLAALWNTQPTIDPAVGEIPSPTTDLAQRGAWLHDLFATPWADWPDDLQAWRRAIPETLRAMPEDTVVFTHFVFIAHAAGDPSFCPDYCSVTVLEDGEVVQQGRSHQTKVL
jgi:broad specificity phosphatase PhoE